MYRSEHGRGGYVGGGLAGLGVGRTPARLAVEMTKTPVSWIFSRALLVFWLSIGALLRATLREGAR